MKALVTRLDSFGDVLLAGPAIRAVAARADTVTVLCGPRGAPAARLLPGVDDILVWDAPWVGFTPPPVGRGEVDQLIDTIDADTALILTSFHQSPLPTALVLRMAGVPWVGAISEDYPGSLLDVRHRVPDDLPEPERALSLAEACGAPLPPGDDGRLAVRGTATTSDAAPPAPYVVLHPGTSVPARAWPPERFREACELLVAEGHRVVVTGAPSERDLTAYVAGSSGADDLGGRTDVAGLAAVLAGADAVVVGNTGPAHLAAAVGTPVVSLFAPTVPAVRWAPYGVPRVLLGDQHAACRDTRATTCPVPGHPCLSSVSAGDVLTALRNLCGAPVGGPAR